MLKYNVKKEKILADTAPVQPIANLHADDEDLHVDNVTEGGPGNGETSKEA